VTAAAQPAPPARSSKRKGTLALIVGPIAAALLLTQVPAEESGRQIAASIAADGTATVRHIAGPQYLKAYLDAVGIATACDGITKGVKLGQRYSEAQCAAMLEAELVEHAEGVKRCTPRLWAPGLDYARVAAVSLTYNVGVGAWCKSTADRRFDAGQWAAACEAIGPSFAIINAAGQRVVVNGFVKGGGRVLPGLVKRRGREKETCLTNLVAGKTPANLPERLKGLR